MEMRKTEMFEHEEGFKNVLTGAYIRMATPALYGKNMTMLLPEYMTQHWTIAANTLPAYISRFDYEQADYKKLLASIWLAYYQTVVNLNTLLGEIDARRDLFTNGNYNLIKGEALGLRAFLHLEVMRLWGDLPGNIKEDQPAIPYVTTVTKDPNKLLSLSYREVSRHLLADLDSAELLLKDDPITYCFNSVLNSPGLYDNYTHPEDPYHFYRQNRFNYYAVKATKARYYHWIGDATAAARYANEVINAVNTDNTPKFALGNENDARMGRLTFPSEHIFAVHNSQARDVITSLFIRSTDGYTQDSVRVKEAYETGAHANDIRYKNNRLWQSRFVQGHDKYFNYFKKYVMNDQTPVEVVPVIRLSEMYFIAIENGHPERFPAYRVARNLSNSLDSELTTPEAIRARLEKEYRKEFYGEGQMFYFYKRHAYDRFTWPTSYTMNLANYKLPRPDVQTIFETL
jgi:hypothetical protein